LAQNNGTFIFPFSFSAFARDAVFVVEPDAQADLGKGEPAHGGEEQHQKGVVQIQKGNTERKRLRGRHGRASCTNVLSCIALMASAETVKSALYQIFSFLRSGLYWFPIFCVIRAPL
jgi:hypothetical protein